MPAGSKDVDKGLVDSLMTDVNLEQTGRPELEMGGTWGLCCNVPLL